MANVRVAPLARLAARLNREAGAPAIPSLFFFTDPDRTPDPLAAAKGLPRGAAVVYRHFGATDRAAMARRLSRLCRARGLSLLIAADPNLARCVNAQGVHWPQSMLPVQPERWGLTLASAHDRCALARADAVGVDAIVLAPVFATRSSSANPPLGLFRASQLARQALAPVIALGGVSARNAALLCGRGFAGIAAVDALTRVT